MGPQPSADVRQGSATPWRRDPSELVAGLTAWARAVRRHDVVVTDVRAPDSGMANDTVLFRLDGEPLVARLSPAPETPYPTFPTYDLERQERVIHLVRTRTSVPVPEVVHLERSDEWLGVPFLVSRAVDGLVPSDNPPYLLDPGGWFLQGTPEQWTRLEVATIGVLAQLHRIVDDGEETKFLQPGVPGDTALERQLADVRAYYEWARDGHSIPVIERAIDMLSATIPPNDRSVLCWGDGRPGNIIYRDFEPVAVLDWEMATVAPPETDVAWLTFFQRFFAGMAEQFDLPPVPDMFGRVETMATYERLSGEALDDLSWYEALSGVRFGAILARMHLRSAAFGMQELPDDADSMIMFAPLLEQMLAEL
jgi:aminoglycoside phosphotransferase (APT) family kinase protein